MTEAMAMACFIVSDRDDTDVANELATSLAPVGGLAGIPMTISDEINIAGAMG